MTATLKRLLALKINEDHIEKVLQSTDDVAACYMPVDWIGQPERVEISEEQYWQQVEQALANNVHHD